MTELLPGIGTPSDAELISRVRGGDVAAYGELFSRHVEAARRLARQLVRGPDVDDLVSEAFAKTLGVIQGGGGPDVAFRAYLLTSVRRLHVDRIRASKRVQPSDDMTLYDDGLPFQDPAVASFENSAAARAFRSLPERWQLVLWHLEVERQKPADIAPLLGMSANSVSALAYRAREGLRQAFLTMHLADCPTEQCRWVNQRLGAYVRKGLSRRDTAKVEQHLDECRRCTAMYLELNEVNSDLAAIVAPLLLGAAAAGYVASSAGAGVAGGTGVVGRVRDAVGAHGGGGSVAGAGSVGTATGAATGGAVATGGITVGGALTAGGAIAAGIAAVTTAVFVFGSSHGQVTDAHKTAVAVRTPGPVTPGQGASGSHRQPTGALGHHTGDRRATGSTSVVVAAAKDTRPNAGAGVTSAAGSPVAGTQGVAAGTGGTDGGSVASRPGDPGQQTGGQDPTPVAPVLQVPGLPPVPLPTTSDPSGPPAPPPPSPSPNPQPSPPPGSTTTTSVTVQGPRLVQGRLAFDLVGDFTDSRTDLASLTLTVSLVDPPAKISFATGSTTTAAVTVQGHTVHVLIPLSESPPSGSTLAFTVSGADVRLVDATGLPLTEPIRAVAVSPTLTLLHRGPVRLTRNGSGRVRIVTDSNTAQALAGDPGAFRILAAGTPDVALPFAHVKGVAASPAGVLEVTFRVPPRRLPAVTALVLALRHGARTDPFQVTPYRPHAPHAPGSSAPTPPAAAAHSGHEAATSGKSRTRPVAAAGNAPGAGSRAAGHPSRPGSVGPAVDRPPGPPKVHPAHQGHSAARPATAAKAVKTHRAAKKVSGGPFSKGVPRRIITLGFGHDH